MAYVYRHIRLDKNEPFYIGIGIDSYRMFSKQNRNRHWRNVVKNSKFEAEILMDNISWEQACEKEREFIKLYGRVDLGTGTLVNLTDGGEGVLNLVLSDQTRIKMSLGQMGNDKWKKRKPYKKPEVHFNKGRVVSEDTKMKIRQAFKNFGHPCEGKKLSEKTKEKIAKKRIKSVLQYTKEGIFVKEYESVKSVVKDGFDKSNVAKCCRKEAKSHKNYIWKFKN
jgi:hypothetical protein